MNNLEPPRTVARLLLVIQHSGARIEGLSRQYAPVAGYTHDDASDVVAVAAGIASAHLGATVTLTAGNEALRVLLCHALGVPPSASFIVAPNTISVVEVDLDGRWVVVRVNEGNPLPGD